MEGKNEGKPDELSRAQAITQANKLEIPKASFKDFVTFYSKWKNGRVLLGTAGSWFLFDGKFIFLGAPSAFKSSY
jgi:PHS family inorganic phosphate transporter-like MFS transporter